MAVINCAINSILTWLPNFIISELNRVKNIEITDMKLYVLVVNLSTQDNPKLLQQLKSGFKRTTNCSKYQPKITI